MLRITADLRSDPIVLKVEGKLKGVWVAELERCWQSTRVNSPGHRLRIELNDITFVEDQGKVLLTEMLHSGVELIATGPNDEVDPREHRYRLKRRGPASTRRGGRKWSASQSAHARKRGYCNGPRHSTRFGT